MCSVRRVRHAAAKGCVCRPKTAAADLCLANSRRSVMWRSWYSPLPPLTLLLPHRPNSSSPPACSRGLAWSSADNPDSPLKPKVSGLWAPLGAPNPHTRTHTYKHTHTHNLPLTTGPTVIAVLILTFKLRHNLRLIKMNVFAHVTFSCQVSDLPHQQKSVNCNNSEIEKQWTANCVNQFPHITGKLTGYTKAASVTGFQLSTAEETTSDYTSQWWKTSLDSQLEAVGW